jgi:hypothetical protein
MASKPMGRGKRFGGEAPTKATLSGDGNGVSQEQGDVPGADAGPRGVSMAILTILTSLVPSVLAKLLTDEIKAWIPRLNHWLLARAVGRLPQKYRGRYAEEWEAVLLDVPGDLGRIFYSLGLLRAAKGIERLSGKGRPATFPVLLKRSLDIVIATSILILFAPLLLIAALLIRFESRGPVVVGLMRVGKDGKPFRMMHFRTMAFVDRRGGGQPRVTRIGSFLRKTSADELPNFINVLKGEMSAMSVMFRKPHAFEPGGCDHRKDVL